MADTIVNADAEINSTQQSALAALAGITTGYIPRKKSDGTYENGPMDFTCANNFDPSVSGQAAPIRSTMVTLDATKAWVKYGTADTAWRSINEERPSTSVTGSSAAALDLTIAIPENRAAMLDVDILANTSAAWTELRIAEASVVTFGTGYIACGGGHTPIAAGAKVNPCLIGAASTRAVIRISKSVSGRRLIRSDFDYNGQSTYCGFGVWTITSGAIAKVGLLATGTTYLPVGSTISGVVSDTGGGIL